MINPFLFFCAKYAISFLKYTLLFLVVKFITYKCVGVKIEFGSIIYCCAQVQNFNSIDNIVFCNVSCSTVGRLMMLIIYI